MVVLVGHIHQVVQFVNVLNVLLGHMQVAEHLLAQIVKRELFLLRKEVHLVKIVQRDIIQQKKLQNVYNVKQDIMLQQKVHLVQNVMQVNIQQQELEVVQFVMQEHIQ